jgi:hypothetical protein
VTALPNPFESVGHHPAEGPAALNSTHPLNAAGSTIFENAAPVIRGSPNSAESDLQVTADCAGAAAYRLPGLQLGALGQMLDAETFMAELVCDPSYSRWARVA